MRISNSTSVNSPQTFFNRGISANKTSSNSTFDTVLKAEASAKASVSQDTISPEDLKYLNLYTGTGGAVHFPSDDAPIQTKKTWIEAMKKLPSDQQMGIKLSISLNASLATKQDPSNPDPSKIRGYISGITSYQDVLRNIITNLKNSTSSPDKYGQQGITEQSINACNTVIDTFSKNNIK